MGYPTVNSPFVILIFSPVGVPRASPVHIVAAGEDARKQVLQIARGRKQIGRTMVSSARKLLASWDSIDVLWMEKNGEWKPPEVEFFQPWILEYHSGYIYIYKCIYIYMYIYIWLLIKIPLSRNGHSSRIKTLLSRNFRELHVYLSRGPCWPTTPLMKIRSPPAKLRQRITDHFLVAF